MDLKRTMRSTTAIGHGAVRVCPRSQGASACSTPRPRLGASAGPDAGTWHPFARQFGVTAFSSRKPRALPAGTLCREPSTRERAKVPSTRWTPRPQLSASSAGSAAPCRSVRSTADRGCRRPRAAPCRPQRAHGRRLLRAGARLTPAVASSSPPGMPWTRLRTRVRRRSVSAPRPVNRSIGPRRSLIERPQ